MDYIPEGYLKMRPDTLEAVRRDVNLNKPGEMKEAVRILDEWVKQQAHFRKKDFPKQYLESTIIASKGSVDRAKTIMDKTCTIRTLVPDKFEPFDVKKELELVRGKGSQIALPQQTEDYHRIFTVKVNTSAAPVINLMYKTAYVLLDYLRLHDYNRGFVMIFDLRDLDVGEALTTLNFNDFKTSYQIAIGSFAVRMKRVHVLTESKLIESLLAIVKPFIKKKTADRITVHRTAEELHQFYPKSILPKDFGGEEKSLQELLDEYLNEVSSPEHKEFMKHMYETRTDESLRSRYEFNDLYAGGVGTFRALSVD